MRLAITMLVTLLLLSGQAVPQGDVTESFAKSFPANVTPVAGVIHGHSSDLSDGFKTIMENAQIAKATGASFLVMTDHLDCIDLTPEQYVKSSVFAFMSQMYNAIGPRNPKLVGAENYIVACRNATVQSGILVVPGIEVTLGGDSDRVFDPAPARDKLKRVVHLLGVGYATPQLCRELSDYLGLRPGIRPQKDLRMDDAQDQVARLMHEAGLAVVVAHPYLTDRLGRVFYTFYKNRIQYVDGVEFFNQGGLLAQTLADDAGSLEVLGLIKRDALQGNVFKPLAVTAGGDYHVGDDYTPFYRWTILGLANVPTCRPERFALECQAVADALRDSTATIIACAHELNRGAMDNGGGIVTYQNGRQCGGNELVASVAIYAHYLRSFVMRLMPECILGSSTGSVDAQRRMAPLMASLALRSQAPVSNEGQLAEFLNTRLSANQSGAVRRPGEVVRPPNFHNYAGAIDSGMILRVTPIK